MAIDNMADKIQAARELREHLLSDRHRPATTSPSPRTSGGPAIRTAPSMPMGATT